MSLPFPVAQNLQQKAALDRQIVDSITDFAIIATDTAGLITRWNEGACRILGWSVEEMVGQPASVFFTPEDVAIKRPETEMEEALLIGRSQDERWHLRKSGERFWASGELMPLKDEDGQSVGFVKVLTDRTVQKVAVTDVLQKNEHLAQEVATRTLERDRVWAVTRDLIVIVGLDGRYRTANPAWTTELHYTEQELLGIRFDELLHPDDRDAAEKSFQETLSGTPPTGFDCRVRAKDGRYRWFSWNAVVTDDLIYVSGRDISARKELERQQHAIQQASEERRIANLFRKQLSAERDRLRVLFEQAPSFMAVLSGPAHVFELTNNAFDRIMGKQTAIGKPVREALPEVEGQRFFELLDEVFASGQAYFAREAPLVLKKTLDAPTRTVYVDFLYQPLTDPDGTVTGIFVDGYDVTDRKHAHDALRELNDTLEQRVAARTAERDRVWRNSPDLLAVYDAAGVLLSVNPAYQTMLGYEKQELVGKSYKDFVHPDDLLETTQRLRQSVDSTRGHAQNRWRHKDGSYRWISWVSTNDQGVLYATGRDITAEKKQQQALELAEESLRQAQKMEAVGQLTGGIAHDFNNMLAGVMSNLEMLQIRVAQGRPKDVGRYVEGAITSVNRAASLTHRLLAFSRRQTLDPRPTDVNQLVVSMEDLIRRTSGPHIILKTYLGPALWRALCDANQLESALLNLAINSRDAMPGGGRLTIETTNVRLDAEHAVATADMEPGEYVRVCVSDTGIGMSAEIASRALEPFFTTKPTGQGTGLGLSMIYGFVKQSKGHLRMRSQPGTGTAVELFLPRHVGDGKIDVVDESRTDVPRAASSTTVLLVEDDDSLRNLSMEMLTDLGYTVFTAEDATSALKLLESLDHIDLLVTDVGLPGGMNGRQLADAAREKLPGLKVLLVTGFAESAAAGNGLVGHRMQVMTKPFSLAAFASKVRSLVENPL